MNSEILTLDDCHFEVLTCNDDFLGLGQIHIGSTQVRSGRLPLRPYSQSFCGLELSRLELAETMQSETEIRLRLRAFFRSLEVKLMRDHSFDPIHETSDWENCEGHADGTLDLVIRPAHDVFNGEEFKGFDYHYEYSSPKVPLFYLLDKASWELDGNITGATAYSQSSCSDPVVKFEDDTSWTTEGVLFFLVESGDQNPIMTHNLPRWASHGSFDFQFKGDKTLLGIFEHVELIRSVLLRESGKAELKTFDKHLFDEATEYSTAPKKILIHTQPKSETAQKNLWTWIHCEVEQRARAEFGLQEEPLYPRLAWNFWENFTVDSYYPDLVTAAEAIGCRELFVDNLKKSAMTEDAPLADGFHWNMCCAHEYEIAEKLGGNARVKKFIGYCREQGIRVASWTNNAQALSSPLNMAERDEGNGWYVLLEDARQKYGGAYMGCQSTMDLSVEAAREHFVQAHLKIKEQTGLEGYLFDSFYNLGFMPISYREMKPRTVWRGCLQAVKQLQDNGVHFLIESFGPFGVPQHGHPSSYNFDTIFICYRIGLGNDYSTVPTGNTLFSGHADDASALYYALAHKALSNLELWRQAGEQQIRIDKWWTDEHKRALADYHAVMDAMNVRYLQEDGAGVLWHNADGSCATLWNFIERRVALPGKVCDLTNDEELPQQREYLLAASHTYAISGCELPRAVCHLPSSTTY